MSTRANNLTERLYKDICKHCKFNLQYVTTKDGTLTFNCMECDKSYKKSLIKI